MIGPQIDVTGAFFQSKIEKTLLKIVQSESNPGEVRSCGRTFNGKSWADWSFKSQEKTFEEAKSVDAPLLLSFENRL